MITKFSHIYIQQHAGCYSDRQLEVLFIAVGKEPDLKQLYDYLPLSDFLYFFLHKCDLSYKDYDALALRFLKVYTKLYKDNYPDMATTMDELVQKGKNYVATKNPIKNLIALDGYMGIPYCMESIITDRVGHKIALLRLLFFQYSVITDRGSKEALWDIIKPIYEQSKTLSSEYVQP